MSPSTASTKSTCLALALLALTSPPPVAALNSLPSVEDSTACNGNDLCNESGASFESAAVIKRVPIHLTVSPLSSDNAEHELAQRNNASAYQNGVEGDAYDGEVAFEEEEFELPAGLAALIAEAKTLREPAPAAAPTLGASTTKTKDEARFYPTYSEGELCSSKLSSTFGSWEESFVTLEDCCEAAFSWDFEACMGSQL